MLWDAVRDAQRGRIGPISCWLLLLLGVACWPQRFSPVSATAGPPGAPPKGPCWKLPQLPSASYAPDAQLLANSPALCGTGSCRPAGWSVAGSGVIAIRQLYVRPSAPGPLVGSELFAPRRLCEIYSTLGTNACWPAICCRSSAGRWLALPALRGVGGRLFAARPRS